jgi:glycosyltransferase involved in cell wall biosynthesis
MKWNWLSPLPPAKTAIANYTGQIMPELCRYADVTLWTDQKEWDPGLEKMAKVRRFDPDMLPEREFNQAEVSFYNIGNNAEFHLPIWQVSAIHPGIIVLHDVKLQEFFAYYYRWIIGNRQAYQAIMGDYYGIRGQEDAKKWWADELSMPYMIERYPLTPLALEGALGVVVHTREAVDFVKDQTTASIAYHPLPYRVTPPPPSRKARGSRTRRPPFRLILFGYIHLNRRLEQLLVALAEMQEKSLFRLDVFGQLWDPAYVAERVNALGLEDVVSIHGFVPEEELDAALDTADLAINLRYPTMGEASESQLQIWDHALPSLVTPVGWYASLPTNAVGFVRPDHEVGDLQTWLRALLSEPNRFAAMGENGRRILEQQHSPTPYVKRLVDIAAGSHAVRRNAAAMRLAARVGLEIGLWCNPQHADLYYHRIAERILPVLI